VFAGCCGKKKKQKRGNAFREKKGVAEEHKRGKRKKKNFQPRRNIYIISFKNGCAEKRREGGDVFCVRAKERKREKEVFGERAKKKKKAESAAKWEGGGEQRGLYKYLTLAFKERKGEGGKEITPKQGGEEEEGERDESPVKWKRGNERTNYINLKARVQASL